MRGSSSAPPSSSRAREATNDPRRGRARTRSFRPRKSELWSYGKKPFTTFEADSLEPVAGRTRGAARARGVRACWMWYANISGEVVAREPHCKGRGIGSRFVSTSKNLLNLLKSICRLKILGNATWIHVYRYLWLFRVRRNRAPSLHARAVEHVHRPPLLPGCYSRRIATSWRAHGPRGPLLLLEKGCASSPNRRLSFPRAWKSCSFPGIACLHAARRGDRGRARLCTSHTLAPHAHLRH